jgi:hypothetical protein
MILRLVFLKEPAGAAVRTKDWSISGGPQRGGAPALPRLQKR